MNGWCSGRPPEGFPLPLLDLGPKTRRWLPLQVRAYVQPLVYAERAALIRPGPETRGQPRRAMPGPPPPLGTLQPLPRPGALAR